MTIVFMITIVIIIIITMIMIIIIIIIIIASARPRPDSPGARAREPAFRAGLRRLGIKRACKRNVDFRFNGERKQEESWQTIADHHLDVEVQREREIRPRRGPRSRTRAARKRRAAVGGGPPAACRFRFHASTFKLRIWKSRASTQSAS